MAAPGSEPTSASGATQGLYPETKGESVMCFEKEHTATKAQSGTWISCSQSRIRRLRDLATFNAAIGSKLRGRDIVKLRAAIHMGDSVRLRTTVVQQKASLCLSS